MIEKLKLAYEEFEKQKPLFDKMNDYYRGKSDAMKQYLMVTERSNNKTPINFVQNFIDEEVSYSVGNDTSYISREGNIEMVENIDYYLSNLSNSHDINLLEKMLINSKAFELYYVDINGEFNSKVISACNGFVIMDDANNIELFMHIYTKAFTEGNFIDVYTNEQIMHYDESFEQIEQPTKHIFGEVPVGIATYNIDEDCTHKTIYNQIKGLQDSYETNLSDISNEISDFRNAYLMFEGVQLDIEDIPRMKEMGIIQTEEGRASWLIKDINDSFIQNTLSTMEEKMYQLTKHINHNEKMQSNTSGLAIQARMLGLLQKCKINQKALSDCIKTRLKMLFIYLKTVNNLEYDFRDVRVIFSANLPSDDLMVADTINKLGDKISLETALSQLSFVENPRTEIDKIKNENSELDEGESLLDLVDDE